MGTTSFPYKWIRMGFSQEIKKAAQGSFLLCYEKKTVGLDQFGQILGRPSHIQEDKP